MRGKFREQLRRRRLLRLSRCCSTLNDCTRPSRTISSSPSIAPAKSQRLDQIGKALGDVLAGARIEPRDRLPSRVAPATACTRMPSHFHSAMKSAGSSAARSASSIACASIAGRNGAGSRARRLLGAAFEPGEQLAVGRREAGPEHLDLVGVLAAERGGRGLGEPRRDADAQAAGDQLEQRPAAGLVERVEPARELRGQLRLAERATASRPPRTATACAFGRCAGSARPHQRDGFRQVADIVVGQPNSTGSVRSAISARIMPGLACWNDSAPVSAASA